MKKLAVIGWPISHSRSPLIHNYWIQSHGFNAHYEKLQIEPDELPKFFNSFRLNNYYGCNVTLPYKEQVIHFLHCDEISRRLKAANTVYWKDNQLWATNTDGEGFIKSLRAEVPDLSLINKAALVIGAGGAARSIIDVLVQNGIEEINLVNRSLEKAKSLACDFGSLVKVLPWQNLDEALQDKYLLVNTTSLGMANNPDLEISLDKFSSQSIVADIVYVPQETGLLRQAKARKLKTCGGLGMLLHQAARGFELWFGQYPTIDLELVQFIQDDIRKAI